MSYTSLMGAFNGRAACRPIIQVFIAVVAWHAVLPEADGVVVAFKPNSTLPLLQDGSVPWL